MQESVQDPRALRRVIGEYLTEPKSQVWFEPLPDVRIDAVGIQLDRKTRMMYDQEHVFINGESYRASGRDAVLMHRLADERCLQASERARATAPARDLLLEWGKAGWLHGA